MSATTTTVPPAGERHVPFLVLLGARRQHAEGGEAEVVIELKPELLNNHGGGHGGVVMTLLDNAMANAALSRIGFTREVVTIDMHVAFMRAATGQISARARTSGGGKSVCFCEAEARDADGELVARAMGTFRYRSP
ncbi:PaaI family thioesterase [Aquincola sp. S2]|uniref:PaaI family thioesterase n=1 Tax=Pseudaquabacterium terrae TaxID=2732868 RepID=A0ABX2EGC3_9BURK|nr:PaaI family thioesterase [Aquabacterium terrae]NRF67669.1 PaaI family thioesterase [Aquabacterium terrae]